MMKGMCYVNGKDLFRARKKLFWFASQFDENTDVNRIVEVADALSIVESNLIDSKFVLRVEDKEKLERAGAL